jgi:virulence factor Mce-like protein
LRRLLSILFVVAVCGAAVVLVGASDDSSDKPTYTIQFDNAFGLVEGGDFRVAGVRAGSTKSFDIAQTKSGAAKGEVEVEVTEPGVGAFRADASCDIKPQSLIGEYYVDCQPGTSPRKLAEGATISYRQTTSTIPIDLVNNILRRPAKERLRMIITELGTGLAGRPDDLAAVVRRAHPGLRETSKVLKILGDQNRVIQNFIVDSDTVIKELAGNRKDVVRFVQTAGDAAEASASRRGELQETFARLPGFLDELRPTMRRLGEVADEQTPLLADLERAAPDFNTFIRQLEPFARNSRPALRALGRASAVGTRAFERGAQEVRVLRQLAADAPAAAKPLRQFLETLDSRERAIDDDPRGKVDGPIPSDPSYGGGRGGFTGFEAIGNYAFWQTLSLNGFDAIGHVLRIAITAGGCSVWVNQKLTDANRSFYENCNQWLGPNQPGLTTPDPTVNTAEAARLRRTNDKPAQRAGERRAPGQPEAGALPGQRDISKPQVVLPEGIQKLLDNLPGRPLVDDLIDDVGDAARRVQGGTNSNVNANAGAALPTDGGVTELLDFLLRP